jgi:hypothetical protein
MTAPVLRANSELVAVAWIASIPGFTAGVAPQVPQNATQWAEHGFVTVMGVGGGPYEYSPVRVPVMQIDTWATQSNSTTTASKPPWYKAAGLAEQILAETFADDRVCRQLTLKPGYPQARVLTATALTEPRRVFGEGTGIARFTFDVQLIWCELPP